MVDALHYYVRTCLTRLISQYCNTNILYLWIFSIILHNYAGTLLGSNKGFLFNLILLTNMFANVIYKAAGILSVPPPGAALGPRTPPIGLPPHSHRPFFKFLMFILTSKKRYIPGRLPPVFLKIIDVTANRTRVPINTALKSCPALTNVTEHTERDTSY